MLIAHEIAHALAEHQREELSEVGKLHRLANQLDEEHRDIDHDEQLDDRAKSAHEGMEGP